MMAEAKSWGVFICFLSGQNVSARYLSGIIQCLFIITYK